MIKTGHNIKTYSVRLTQTALLCAIGILIPMVMPIRLVIEPMSFTLAAHVAIFIAMFISPSTAIAVTLGTTAGFFLGGFPIVIVARAASHIFFAALGALYIKKNRHIMHRGFSLLIFSFFVAIVHAVAEVISVIPFYFAGGLPQGFYARGFIMGVMVLVGVGTIVHSMVDFAIARLVWRPLRKSGSIE